MSSSTPTGRSLANREKIYHAAITLIRRDGFGATTMQDIAQAAGVARASVFNHFPGKALFLAEYYRRFTRQVIAAAREIAAPGLRGQIETLFVALDAAATADKPLIAEIAALTMPSGPLGETEREVDHEMLTFLREAVDQGQASGEIRHEIEPAFLAEFLLGILTNTAQAWVNSGQTISLSAGLLARFDVVIQGIAPR
tara:strand:- start:2509 stop:3102 length:594 start_codon:yes stop_codon:yes gene_type:complete